MTAISKKVCMLGEFAVGKTSLVRRFVFERFDDRYISTIGVKVSRKTVVMTQRQDTVQLTMMLWDLAGSEEFNQLRTSYLRGSTGIILVCDLTRPETLTQLPGYVETLHSIGLVTPLVLAANKADLHDDVIVTEAQVAATAQALARALFLTASAKIGDEVERFASSVVGCCAIKLKAVGDHDFRSMSQIDRRSVELHLLKCDSARASDEFFSRTDAELIVERSDWQFVALAAGLAPGCVALYHIS